MVNRGRSSTPTSARLAGPPASRSITHTATASSAPSAPRAWQAAPTAPPDATTAPPPPPPAPGHVQALGQAAGPIRLGLLADEPGREAGDLGQHRGQGHPAQLQ